MFPNVVACWPGSTHDSHVFCTSNICIYLPNNCSLDDGILGDSGYGCSLFSMTLYTTTQRAAQVAYNDAHAKTSGDWANVWPMEKAFSCVAFGNKNGTRKSLYVCRHFCNVAQHCFTATRANGGWGGRWAGRCGSLPWTSTRSVIKGPHLSNIFWLRFSHAVLNSVLRFIIIGATL